MAKSIALNRIEYGGRDTSGKNIVTVFEEGDEVVGLPDAVMREFMLGKTVAYPSHKDAIAAVRAKTTRERAATAAVKAFDDGFAADLVEQQAADKDAKKVTA